MNNINPVQQGINLLQVGALRMPMLGVSLVAAQLVLEGAIRITATTLDFFGITGESRFMKGIRNATPDIAVKIIRPYGDEKAFPAKTLIISAISATIIGTLGTEAIKWLFGPARGVYNCVLKWLGPLRVTNDTHPFIAWLAQRFGG